LGAQDDGRDGRFFLKKEVFGVCEGGSAALANAKKPPITTSLTAAAGAVILSAAKELGQRDGVFFERGPSRL